MKATTPLFLALTLVIAGSGTAQKGKTVTKSSTHRVVVVNGKKVVDERTENGKPVKGSGKVDDIDIDLDADEMIRKMRERMKRARKKLGAGEKGKNSSSSSSSSSQTKRRVVENGKVIIEEETRNGKPVKKGKPTKKAGSFEDLDTFDHSDRTKGLGKERKKLAPRKSKNRVVLGTGE